MSDDIRTEKLLQIAVSGDNAVPWALPLLDMRFDAGLRFCSERCLNAYVVERGSPPSGNDSTKSNG